MLFLEDDALWEVFGDDDLIRCEDDVVREKLNLRGALSPSVVQMGGKGRFSARPKCERHRMLAEVLEGAKLFAALGAANGTGDVHVPLESLDETVVPERDGGWIVG